MERTGIGNIAPPASPGSAQPYRRHIVGLPLQRSLFGKAAEAATTIGLPGLTRKVDFPARLDENGDLFLDRSKVAALADALALCFTPETLERMHTTHAAASDALIDATQDAARAAASVERVTTTSLEDLANRTALVLAYGILSKFVPDVLLRALADSGDVDPPPFPRRSAGAELMQETFALYEACCGLDYGPQRLQREWPRVPAAVFQLITEFCKRQTGFGPLAWDSPGYEDPAYIVRLLRSAFDRVDPKELKRHLYFRESPAVTKITTDCPPTIAALRRLLGFWLEFLERETWYVRRAFYVGMVPLLRQFATEYRQKIPDLHITDLLFLDIKALNAGAVDPAMIRTRRDRYVANTEYLSVHGIGPNRLTTMMGAS
jgi:hypothetical protein